MNGVRAFFELVGAFWAITIISFVMVSALIFGLWQAGFLFQVSAAKHQQVINNAQYNANQDSQQYQQTYLSQADKTYQQITMDKYNIDQAKSAGDTTLEQDGYAAAQNDIHTFCTDAAKLTDLTKGELTPDEMGFFNKNC